MPIRIVARARPAAGAHGRTAAWDAAGRRAGVALPDPSPSARLRGRILLLELVVRVDLDLPPPILLPAGGRLVVRHRLLVAVALRGHTAARDALRPEKGDHALGAPHREILVVLLLALVVGVAFNRDVGFRI